MARIVFLGLDGCGFSGISGLMDALNIASQVDGRGRTSRSMPLFETRIVSPEGRPFQASAGGSGRCGITADSDWEDVSGTDMVVIPPFLPNAEVLNTAPVLEWLRACHARGTPLAALCTGTFVLAQTGLLDGCLATTNWVYADLFKRRFPRVRLQSDRVLTRDRGLICTGAVSAFYHLALYLIQTFGSETLARRCAKIFLVDYSRTSQASYAAFNMKKDHGDDPVFRAQEWMEAHLNQTISITALAGRAGISQRQFIRRFQTATGQAPLSYLQQLRVETAKQLLETGTDTVDQITRQVGYENTSTFCRLFKKIAGVSPGAYRERFAREMCDGESPDIE